jgi:hypothetical protein
MLYYCCTIIDWKRKKRTIKFSFYLVAGSTEISNSLKRDLLEIGALYDYIEDYKKYADIGDSCGINTIN